MSHILGITDGTSTANLSTGNCYLMGFVPVPVNEVSLIGTSTIDVLFHASTPVSASSYKIQLERLFEHARRRAKWGNGARVYLNFEQDGSGVTQRAEVLDGWVEMTTDSVAENLQNKLSATIGVTHGPWEGARTALTTTNSNGTGTTPLLIYNHDDATAGHDNYATVTSSYALGVLPAPLEIQLTNITSTKQFNSVHISNDAIPSLSPILEGESATVTGGSSVGGSYSGGFAMSFTVNTTNTLSWTLTTAQLAYLAGRNVRIIGKFEFTGTVYAKWWLQTNTGSVITTPVSPEVPLVSPNYLQDLGPLPLPPGGLTVTDWASMTLVISFRSTSSVAMKCDFVQLTFSDEGCYRKLQLSTQAAYTFPTNDLIVDDGIDGFAYAITSGYKLPIVLPRGKAIMLFPGQTQSFRFLFDGASYSVDWTLNVQLFFRPRYLLPV